MADLRAWVTRVGCMMEMKRRRWWVFRREMATLGGVESSGVWDESQRSQLRWLTVSSELRLVLVVLEEEVSLEEEEEEEEDEDEEEEEEEELDEEEEEEEV